VSTFFTSPLRVVGGTAVGVGVGSAVADAIAPVVRELANEAWSRYLSLPLDAIAAAAVVASGERPMTWGIGEAANTGIGEERFRALVDMIDQAPDLGTLFDLLHRGLISVGDFREGARKGNIEDKWIDALVALSQRILSPAEAANAWQQGFMDEGEASAEAALSGVSSARSAIQRQLAGNPPGPMDGLTLLRRGIISESEYVQLVREGNIKTKYTEPLLGLREHIIPGREAAGLWLRGWITEDEAKAAGARDGWGPDEMERLYQNRGRPATVRQVHIGFARGGRHPDEGNNEIATLRRAIRQSNVRTEWEDLLIAQRFTYPSAFVIRALASDGTFDQALTEGILIESGWRPEWAQLAAEKWSGGGAGPSTKWADRARGRLFTAAHSDYLDGNADEADARAMLAAVGVGGAEQSAIITLWNLERSRTRRDLTQAQILKLYKKAVWTREQALDALDDLGMEAGDASDLLDAV
jgi:hypothetical protein